MKFHMPNIILLYNIFFFLQTLNFPIQQLTQVAFRVNITLYLI